MSYAGAVVSDIPARLTQVKPLALASAVPIDLTTWINRRDYAALFSEAFGSAGITPARIALAIASYERTLNANQTPFDRPNLYSESNHVPVIQGLGAAGSAGIVPSIMAIEPPLLGNKNFTVQVSRGLSNAVATLVVGDSDPGVPNTATVPVGSFANIVTPLNASGDASVQLSLPDGQAQLGRTLYGRIYVADPAAANGFAVTSAFKITLFGESDVLMQAGFE